MFYKLVLIYSTKNDAVTTIIRVSKFQNDNDGSCSYKSFILECSISDKMFYHCGSLNKSLKSKILVIYIYIYLYICGHTQLYTLFLTPHLLVTDSFCNYSCMY